MKRRVTSAGSARLAWLLLLPAVLSGCAALPGTMADTGLTGDSRACFRFFNEVDRRVDEAGVRDGAEHRLPGFPYLRSDRFTASFASRFSAAAGDDAVAGAGAAGQAADRDGRSRIRADALEQQRGIWIGRMAGLDLAARRHETANLPPSSFPVAGYADAAALRARVAECSALLVGTHAADPDRARTLARASQVPDDYSALRRAVGLYPFVGIGIAAGIRSWESQNRAAFQRDGMPPEAERMVYQRYLPQSPPPSAEAAVATARAILGRAPVDALGIPQLDAGQILALAQAFAPTFEVGTSAEQDRFGPLQWIDLGGLVWPGSDRYWLDVDSSQPVVYHRLAFSRYGGAVLPQIVYSIWFPERAGPESSDWEAGRLDGLVWRVTLDPTGVPLLYDAVHPSGCCHQFFHTSRLMPKIAPASHEVGEWAFAPLGMPIDRWLAARRASGSPSGGNPSLGQLPAGEPDAGEPVAGQRSDPPPALAGMALRIASHRHHLVGIGAPSRSWGDPQGINPGYRLVDADQLRSLPRPGSSPRSIYDPDGLVVGSERFLRFVLWPSGIDSAGTLRQYGRQPTAFIGRRHFDDADLLERRFRWRDAAP